MNFAEANSDTAGADLDQLATMDDFERATSRLDGSRTRPKWMIGFILALVVAIGWRVFG